MIDNRRKVRPEPSDDDIEIEMRNLEMRNRSWFSRWVRVACPSPLAPRHVARRAAAALLGVLALRISQPDIERPFRVPAIYLVAPAGALSAVLLMLGLPGDTWLRLGVWLILGLVIYFLYGMRHSRVAHEVTKRCFRGRWHIKSRIYTQLAPSLSFWHMMRGLSAMRPYLEERLQAAREHGGEGLIAELVRVEKEGGRISADEMVAMVFLLLGAGSETTTMTSLRQSLT